jgi:hypothetical protein
VAHQILEHEADEQLRVHLGDERLVRDLEVQPKKRRPPEKVGHRHVGRSETQDLLEARPAPGIQCPAGVRPELCVQRAEAGGDEGMRPPPRERHANRVESRGGLFHESSGGSGGIQRHSRPPEVRSSGVGHAAHRRPRQA